MNAYDSAFAARVHESVTEYINKIATSVGGGGCIKVGDAATTGMNYARQVGSIEALRNVLEILQEVSDEMSGRNQKRA